MSGTPEHTRNKQMGNLSFLYVVYHKCFVAVIESRLLLLLYILLDDKSLVLVCVTNIFIQVAILPALTLNL